MQYLNDVMRNATNKYIYIYVHIYSSIYVQRNQQTHHHLQLGDVTMYTVYENATQHK